uniref:Uncharacterized protein n=1 Tax=Globisporangium ultimum (strain ATCC 200006 / CBS 805.95 / DAOM BR144) TaxID=431595 RepID=K3XCX5_GLOUD
SRLDINILINIPKKRKVNGGRNSDGPKVAKFLVGISGNQ